MQTVKINDETFVLLADHTAIINQLKERQEKQINHLEAQIKEIENLAAFLPLLKELPASTLTKLMELVASIVDDLNTY